MPGRNEKKRQLGSGIAGFDRLLMGLRPGDNIVWQLDSIEDYLPFARPFADYASKHGFKPVYFHFARHQALLDTGDGILVFELSPEEGFEVFIRKFHNIINDIGEKGFYIFDCLSDLVVDWYSDRMLGNFFMLVCPFIRQAGGVAYFALLRNRHSFHAMTPIINNSSVFLDVHRSNGKLYVHPIKTPGRYSPTMNMIHVWEGDEFLPVGDSVTITEILANVPWSRLDSASYRLGFWSSTFARAEEVHAALIRGENVKREASRLFDQLLRMAIAPKGKLLSLARKYLTLSDVLNIRKRMIGTGQIGGKSVGMLLARAILKQENGRWDNLLEPHDSFFIGSDVFYTFLVRNEIWWLYQKQGIPGHFLEDVEEGRRRMLEGKFPGYIVKQFADMLDYFGQSPIIVRSSSLLEDNFGNAFAGKYESIFCVNQGSRHERLESFLSALKRVYSSTMSEEALTYRRQRGLLERDEQMAILIQRVSGSPYGNYFYPQAAGVAFSFNPYVWSEYIDAESGMLRLVFGLGTRAVDRIEDDYVRIVALNAPERRVEADVGEARQFSQKYVDILDLDSNELASKSFEDVAENSEGIPLDIFATEENDAEIRQRPGEAETFHRSLTFDKLLLKYSFTNDMREILGILKKAYDYPVDLEFTVNFFGNGAYKINIVQCRPLQLKGGGSITPPEPDADPQDIILDVQGPVIGPSRCVTIDRLVYIDPDEYGQLSIRERHSVARMIGRITRMDNETRHKTIMLIGAGRWGTTTPSLGLPVSFPEISNASVICEIASVGHGIYPDISLGTHFFSDLIEMDILYLGILPFKEGTFINREFFKNAPNKIGRESMPEEAAPAKVIKVLDPAEFSPSRRLRLYANVLEQRFICFLEPAHPD